MNYINANERIYFALKNATKHLAVLITNKIEALYSILKYMVLSKVFSFLKPILLEAGSF